MSALHRLLLADLPRSRLHARCQRVYLGWLAFRRNPIALAGLGIVAGLIVCAALAPWLTGSNGLEPDLGNRLRPPDAGHWLGTDELGRDIYDRIVWGARITLYIVGLVSVIVVPIGLVIGVVAGYAGGWLDNALMRLTDVFLAFPRLILALAFVAALGPGLENAVLAIALTTWSPYARIARAEALTIRKQRLHPRRALTGDPDRRDPGPPRHAALRVLGDRAPHPGHGGHHPHRGGLGFLGLGAQPPTPEWGR